MGFAAPAILRTFGVPVASGMWRLDRRNQHLNKMQYVWGFGVFSWGLGMFLFFTVSRYLDWKLLDDKFSRLSPVRILFYFLIWLAAGWITGIFGAPHRENAHSINQ